MVNPGCFKGVRHKFLENKKAGYIHADVGRVLLDQLTDIQCCFFKRFPIDHGDDFEPTADELAAVDDNTLDEEPVAPDKTKMLAEAFVKVKEEFEAQSVKIKFHHDVSGHVSHNRDKQQKAYFFLLNSKSNDGSSTI